MRKIILLVHLSIDGFVAGPGGDLGYFSPSDENLAFVNSFTAGADAALFGRNSYELLEGHWPQQANNPESTQAEIDYSNWYNAAQKIVVSNTSRTYPDTKVMTIHENLEATLSGIKQQPGKNILIFGAPSLSQSLMELGLIDEFRIFIHPSFFGQGLPLFPALSAKAGLRLIQSSTLLNGELALHYVKDK